MTQPPLCLRVLTVGFANPTLIIRLRRFQSSSLGARTSASADPGGRSVGQAVQFCLAGGYDLPLQWFGLAASPRFSSVRTCVPAWRAPPTIAPIASAAGPSSCTHPLASAQSCGINCAQIATVPMNSVIDANVAASSMKVFSIAGLPQTTSPSLQISAPGDRSGRTAALKKSARLG